MSLERDAYINELYLLSRVNIEQWNKFVEAYRIYALPHVEQMLGAPSDEIKMAVGRVREALFRLDEMQKIEELYAKIREKKDGPRRT